ncbi:MAG: N-acetyl-gamma-glutamyl-phosphate reductase [Candidatus Tectomicrobia bacterium]|uniref:N-acetyl-gamma-glutamyl-phosphate reductase n=1 Tax=Tectimicrobiota bacterium TaxID=2528274 RepID=A0A932GS78_UNCTE|nr:N-acetyl-gamma-glutamyl-phosphate reductase [Candidatus Tectomicrobia bacterium]
MDKLKVAIAGASGYTGAELLRLLWSHPRVKVTHATADRYAGQVISRTFPSLQGYFDGSFTSLDDLKATNDCDLVFVALPHKTAMGVIPGLLDQGKKVVDLSADFRLRDPGLYEEWYGITHSFPGLLGSAVYGLPEVYRREIHSAVLVANPGCYPTGAILALLPVLGCGVIREDSIVIDAKSGVSGAGRQVDLAYLFGECNESVRAYGLGRHRHTPEIEQELSVRAGGPVRVSFTPHLIPMTRGILTTAYASLTGSADESAMLGLYQKQYASEPFVRVRESGQFPATKDTLGSNFCDVGIYVDRRVGRLIVVSALDNLVKGAAGQAIQNMNLMFGFDEREGLEGAGLFP